MDRTIICRACLGTGRKRGYPRWPGAICTACDGTGKLNVPEGDPGWRLMRGEPGEHRWAARISLYCLIAALAAYTVWQLFFLSPR